MQLFFSKEKKRYAVVHLDDKERESEIWYYHNFIEN